MSKRCTIKSLLTSCNSVIHNSVIFNEDNDLTLQRDWGLTPNYVVYLFWVVPMCYNIHTKEQSNTSVQCFRRLVWIAWWWFLRNRNM